MYDILTTCLDVEFHFHYLNLSLYHTQSFSFSTHSTTLYHFLYHSIILFLHLITPSTTLYPSTLTQNFLSPPNHSLDHTLSLYSITPYLTQSFGLSTISLIHPLMSDDSCIHPHSTSHSSTLTYSLSHPNHSFSHALSLCTHSHSSNFPFFLQQRHFSLDNGMCLTVKECRESRGIERKKKGPSCIVAVGLTHDLKGIRNSNGFLIR